VKARYKVLLGLVIAAGLVLAAGAALLMTAGLPTYEVPTTVMPLQGTPEEVARGRSLASVLCRRCHFDATRGRFTGRELPFVDEQMGHAIAPNLTRDPEAGIGAWTPGQLSYLLRTGVNPVSERLTPPVQPRWPRLADSDAAAIAAFFVSDDPWVAPDPVGPGRPRWSPLVTWRAYMDWEPLAYPTGLVPRPSPDDPVAHGAYLVDALYRCHACHSDDPEGIDRVDARSTPGWLGGGLRMQDAAGEGVIATNLTPDPTGLADWSTEDLRRALVDGFRPDGELVRWPMPRYPALDDLDIEAIYAYLRTVPPIERTVERPPRRVIGRVADPGRHVYEAHGCPSCHGHDGVGVGDLRDVAEHFPDDASLLGFLQNPGVTDPDHPMPAFRGVIAESDWAPLLTHVRKLAADGTVDR
jgi:mono/diheme cytochrome c family protein